MKNRIETRERQWRPLLLRTAFALGMTLLLAGTAVAQGGTSPWENAVNVLQQAFTGTIARAILSWP